MIKIQIKITEIKSFIRLYPKYIVFFPKIEAKFSIFPIWYQYQKQSKLFRRSVIELFIKFLRGIDFSAFPENSYT